MNDIPELLALIVGKATVELHVPCAEESNITMILEFDVTAVVLTTTSVAPAATTTVPDAALPHAAGDADDTQFVVVA